MMEPLKGWVVLQRLDCGIRASICCSARMLRVSCLHRIKGNIEDCLRVRACNQCLLQVSLVQQLLMPER